MNKSYKKKILIFYQSIADISEIYELIYKYRYEELFIIITGGKNLLPILNKLELTTNFDIKIFEFHVLKKKNLFNIFKMYFRYNFSSYAKLIYKYNFDKAFFFTQYIDFSTPIFINKCNIKELYRIDFYKNKTRNDPIKIGLKQILHIFILNFIQLHIKSKIKLVCLLGTWPIEVPYFYSFNKTIQTLHHSKNYKHPLFTLPIKLESKFKNAIYLDANEEDYLSNYNQDNFKKKFYQNLKTVFNIFIKSHTNIIIKKHSRERISKKLSNFNQLQYLYEPIPIEFYDLSNIDFIIGYSSSGLIKINQMKPNIKIISIAKLIDSNILSYKSIFYFHKNMMSDNKIYYPSSFIDLKKIIS